MANKYRDALVQIHRDLYPERYIPADELEDSGYDFDGDCVRWHAGTIEWVAQAIEDALHGTRAGVVFDESFRPLTKEGKARLDLTVLERGREGELTWERKAPDAWHFRAGEESWDENLDGAVQLLLEHREIA